MLKKVINFCILIVFVLSGTCIYMYNIIPQTMYFTKGEDMKIHSLPMISLSKNSDDYFLDVSNQDKGMNYTAHLLGVIPIKQVTAIVHDEKYVSVSGEPFGVKMFSDGVMVVGFSDIRTPTGYQNPAKQSGIAMGDLIISMNNVPITSKDDIQNVITLNQNTPITVKYSRDGEVNSLILTASYDIESQSYRTGMWIRDSSAGIGTMTYYDTTTSSFAGLGHAIKDVDTGEEIPLLTGEIVPVEITGVTKSKQGQAGELIGTFLSQIPSGEVLLNNETGVYGKAYFTDTDNMMPIAPSTQIETDKAYIYTTINGTQPAKYEVEVEKVYLNTDSLTKNLIIKITDNSLLALTGGIVQGMSGSPIVQDGKIIGAVTHVFVNDPTRGYGIFIENMLKSAKSVA